MSADAVADACQAFVSANPSNAEAIRIVSTLLTNLAREDIPKFRRVNLQNAKIKACVAAVPTAKGVLLATGFEVVDDGAALEMKHADGAARAAHAAAKLDAAAEAGGAPFTLQFAAAQWRWCALNLWRRREARRWSRARWTI